MALCNVFTQAHKFCALEAHGTNGHSMHLYSTFLPQPQLNINVVVGVGIMRHLCSYCPLTIG